MFFFKQKTAYEMRISDWSSDVCSSDLVCNDSRILKIIRAFQRRLRASHQFALDFHDRRVEEDVHQQRHVVLFEGIEQKRQRPPVFFERHIVLAQSRAHSIHDIADHCVYTSFVCHLPILPGDPFLFSGTDLLQPLSPLGWQRSEEHTSELQSLMRTSYAVFCLKTK